MGNWSLNGLGANLGSILLPEAVGGSMEVEESPTNVHGVYASAICTESGIFR